MSTTDPIRAKVQRLVDAIDGVQDWSGTYVGDCIDALEDELLAQPPEPAEGPIPVEELRASWNQQADEFNQWKSLDLGEQLAWAQARAAARCSNRQPEPAEGASEDELQKKEALLPPNFIDSFVDDEAKKLLIIFYAACQSEGGTTDEVTVRGLRAVLARYGTPRPVPIAVADVRYEFSVFDSETDEWAASGEAPTLEDAIREGNHYLAQYNEDGPHRLELREVRVLPAPPIAAELGEAS